MEISYNQLVEQLETEKDPDIQQGLEYVLTNNVLKTTRKIMNSKLGEDIRSFLEDVGYGHHLDEIIEEDSKK
jgi:hypothetical protein